MPFLLTNDAVEICQEINAQGDVLLAFMTMMSNRILVILRWRNYQFPQ